jgi:hypothetical protein
MNVNLDMTLTVSPDVMLQEIDGEAVLLDLKSEKYFGLNAVGTRIWGLVEGRRTLHAIHAELAAEYPEVDPMQLQRDMERWISELVDAGLLRVETPSGTPV